MVKVDKQYVARHAQHSALPPAIDIRLEDCIAVNQKTPSQMFTFLQKKDKSRKRISSKIPKKKYTLCT